VSFEKAKIAVEIVDIVVRVWSVISDRREAERERKRKEAEREKEVADLRAKVEKLEARVGGER
jgi:hypothetical protein